MSWSFRIATIGGTAVRVHVTFALLLVWIWFMHYRAGGTAAAWQGVGFILAVFACVVLHEFGHAAAARYFGIATRDITLLPIGGLARLDHMPEEPGREFVIAVAGPLVNVVIAALIFAVLGASVGLDQLAQVENPQVGFLARLAGVNVFLVLFNAIPAFPMDGGRVLRAALASRMSWPRATEIAASIGQGVAFVFGFVGLLYNPILIFIAIFVYLAAAAEAQDAQIRDVARSVRVGDVMMTELARLAPDTDIDHAISTLLATSQAEFPVVDADGRLAGLLTRDDMIRALREGGPQTKVANAMRTGVPTAHRREALQDALKSMREAGAPAVAVLDEHDRLAGLVTHETIGEMLMVRSAMPEGFRFGRRRG